MSAGGREVGRISVRVAPNLDGFRRTLKRQLDEIEKTLETKVNVTPDMNGFREKVNATTKGLSADVKLNVDRSEFDRLQQQLTTMAKKLPKLDVGSSGSPLGFVPGGPAGAAAIAALVLSVIGPAMGVLTGSLLALPGLIAGIAVPIGALALGIDGLKKAAEKLKGPFDELKQVMSTKVEQQFTPVFDKLLNVFPTLKAALPSVTQGMADVAQSLVDMATSSKGLDSIKQIAENIGAGLSKSAPGIGDFASGILELVRSFSGKLPDLGNWITEQGKRFSDWITEMSNNGKLDKIWDGLGRLGDALVNVFANIGDSSLTFFDNPEGVERWAKAIEGIGFGLSKILEFSNMLSSTGLTFGLTGILDQLNANGTLEQIKSAFTNMWETIRTSAATALESIVTVAVPALQGIVSAVVDTGAQVMAEVGSWPGKIQGFFAGAITWLESAGRDVVQGLINGITSMVGAAVAKAQELASSVKDAVTGFFGIHSPSRLMHDLGSFIGQGLVNGLESQKDAITGVAKGISQSVADQFSPQKIVDIGTGFADANIGQFQQDIGLGKGALSKAMEVLPGYAMQAAGSVFNFNVANVDDAIAVKNNQINKQALGLVGRG